MSQNRFNQYSTEGDANVTNGSLDIFGYSLRASNLNPSQPLKTNSINQLISTKLDIQDINNLQAELDTTIKTPYSFGDIVITAGNIVSNDVVTDDITSLNTTISNIESSVADKVNKSGDTMTGNLNMSGNSIQGVFQMNVDELNEKTIGYGIYTNNTLYTTDILVTGNKQIKTDNIAEATLTSGINVLSNVHMNDGIIDQVNEIKCDSIDSKLGVLAVNFPSDLLSDTVFITNIREKVLLAGITCQANLNMFGKNITNTNSLYIDNIYERTGLLGINIRNDMQLNNKNLLNCNNIQTLEIKSSGASINFQDDLDIGSFDINNCNEIRTNNLSSSTNPAITLNSDLDFQNTYNLINIDSINNIRPSGGLYSQSNLTQFTQTVETNMLGGANNSGSLTIPANTFKQLSVYSFKSSGVLTGGSNDLFTLRLKSGSATFATLPVTINDNGLNNVWWDLSADFSINTLGIAGVAVLITSVVFRYINNTGVVSTRAVSNINNTTFDTTISNTLEFTFQNDVTNPLTFLQMNASAFTQWY